MKNFILYGTLLLAFTADHFYQLGEINSINALQSQELTEAYAVADKLSVGYIQQREQIKKLKLDIEYLRDANEHLIRCATPTTIRSTPLPKMKG